MSERSDKIVLGVITGCIAALTTFLLFMLAWIWWQN